MENNKRKPNCRNQMGNKKKWRMNICSSAAESPQQNLPHDIILGNILTRLPIQNLVQECLLVCKLWYKSIIHDPHFQSSHSLHYNRNQNLIFSILNKSPGGDDAHHAAFNLDIDDIDHAHAHAHDDNHVYNFRKLSYARTTYKKDMVGYCNGLVCFRSSTIRSRAIFRVINPSYRRKDSLGASYPIHGDAFIVCCGFGFDSLANQYKIVLVTCNPVPPSSSVIHVHDKFKCIVFTLGSKSWRESSTTTLPVIPANVAATCTRIIQKKGMVLSRMSFSRSAVYVAGALYWRVLARDEELGGTVKEEETEMLMRFDIHDEQFQLISLPAECELKIKTGTTEITTDKQQELVDHRLLEFKGSPCIARLQTMTSGEEQQIMNCNCCCKVHLYVLKDGLKSVWTRESFDVCIPNCACIIATATAATTTTVTVTVTTGTTTTTTTTATSSPGPITQILCSSNRVILYWFDGKGVRFYDLRRKHLKTVKYTSVDHRTVPWFNPEKLRKLPRSLDDDFDMINKFIYCRRDHIDYKLDVYVENFLPLQTFAPSGSTKIKNYNRWFDKNRNNGDGLGYVSVYGGFENSFYHCFCK